MAIENKIVIITGASSGIGQATAKLLASKGAKIVLGARREDKLKALTEEIQKLGEKLLIVSQMLLIQMIVSSLFN